MNVKRLLEIPKKRLLKKICGYDEIYTVALRKCEGKTLPEANTDMPFIPITYSKDFWYADPILFSYQGLDFLFVEEYDRKLCKGQIAVALVSDSPKDMLFKTIIKEPYHMSFPMIFKWNNQIFMIPETSENFSFNIYQAVYFPYEWKCISSIKTEKKYVDSVVVEKNNQNIVLLCSEICDENPLKTCFRKFIFNFNNLSIIIPDLDFNQNQKFNLYDRNAGPIIKIGSSSIIPTQNSNNIDYGISIMFRSNINDKNYNYITSDSLIIDKMDKEDIIGVHTYSQTKAYEAIDIRYMKFSPVMQYRKIINSKKVFRWNE